jgi:hypothetical protein
MSETAELIIGILVLLAVISLIRRYHTWRIQSAYKYIIEDLKSKGALDPGSAVELPYAQKRTSKMGLRDHRLMALDHLVFDNIVSIVDEKKYYLKDTTLIER